MNKDDYNHALAKEIWEKHRPYVELLAQVNNSCVFAAEKDRRYLFLSPNFNTFGYSLDELQYTEQQGDFLEKRIHPDDLLVLADLQIRVLNYIFGLPLEERTNYKHIFEFRVLNANEEYIRVISQHQILEISEVGEPLIMLGVADVSPDQSPESNVKFRLVNSKTGEIVPFPVMDSTVKLSKREVEVLKMVNDGMLSKEISNQLSISIHTVNRHRQNILEKMDVDNLMEAINYARKLALLN